MRFFHYIFFLKLLFASYLFSAEPRAEDLIDIQLISDWSVASPDIQIWIGLEISLAPDWHIYWKNAGVSGYPSTLRWDLPRGWSASPMQFPAPYLYQYEGLSGYALKNNFILLVQLSMPETTERNPKISGVFDALICNESTCLPYEFKFSLDLNETSNPTTHNRHISLIHQAKSLLPFDFPEGVSTNASYNGKNGKIFIQSDKFSLLSPKRFAFFPENPSILPEHSELFFSKEKNVLEMDWSLAEGENLPLSIDGILTHPGISNGWRLSMPLTFDDSTTEASKVVAENNSPPNEFFLLTTLIGFVLLAMAVWAYSRSRHPQALVKNWQILASICFFVGLWLVYPKKTPASSSSLLKWEVWSQQRQDDLLRDGRAVYVDYTAKWCLSCQVNKRVYRDRALINTLIDKDVHLLRADWTKKSTEIHNSLQAYGREGVPFNVYFPASKNEPMLQPVYLPEILSASTLVSLISEGQSIEDDSPPETENFIALLSLAWLGGLILNLMPCVFPVIGLKIMSFVKQAGEDRYLISRHGWVFTFGVVLSFWVLVGILLFLRDGLEQQLGWGFQLQEPVFVLILAVLLFFFGLSLSGVFELGMSLTGLGAGLSHKSGLQGTFFSGVLATVIATPCMAPFLGVAVGAALTMPVLPAFAVFTSIALGLSSPYLLLSFFPGWVEKLPKPGLWMESFKQFMAFPVYATVAWLIWTLQGLL